MHTIGKNQSLQLKYIITLDAFIEKDLQIRNTTSILKTFPTESNIGSSICAHSPVKRRREWPCLSGPDRWGVHARSRTQRLDSSRQIHTCTCEVFLAFKLNLGGFFGFPLQYPPQPVSRLDSSMTAFWNDSVALDS